MKKILVIVVGIVIIVGIVLAVKVLFFSTPPTTTVPNTNYFPTASSTSSTPNTPASGSATMTVATNDTATLQTKDFINNGITIEDPANKGSFFLAGNSGACKPDGTCPTAGTQTDYTIVYYPKNGSFSIGLAAEPLGQVRKEAEQYLQQTLGVSQAQMCSLKYDIGTTIYVSAQYGGKNLGFSFCPNATLLP
jgi:cytoskeletal protein RodZ